MYSTSPLRSDLRTHGIYFNVQSVKKKIIKKTFNMNYLFIRKIKGHKADVGCFSFNLRINFLLNNNKLL